MISKLYSLKKYLNNFGFLSEAFEVEALVKFAKLTQGENTLLFEQAFPDEDPEERKDFADRFYEIFKFLKDDEMYRGIVLSASSFNEIKTKIEECEEAVSSIQNTAESLGLPTNAANKQAKQYLYKSYEELGSPNYLNKLDGIQSKKDFFDLLRTEKKKVDESKLEKYDLSAEKIAGLSPKEVDWIIKILDIAEAGGEAHSADDAISMIKVFHKERDKFDKEIWEFDSYSAAQSYLDSKSMVSEAAYMESIKDAAQSNEMSKIVYEDDQWKVVLIGSTIAGQYWRHATRSDPNLCIGTLTNNLFADKSLDEGIDPYFIIDKKNLHSSNPMRMFTISTERDPYKGGSAQIQGQDNLDGSNVSTMTNANNVGINISKIKEALGSDYDKIISVILDDANSRVQTLGRQNADKISNFILNREIALNNLEKIIFYIPEYIANGEDLILFYLNIPELTRKVAITYVISYPEKFANTFLINPRDLPIDLYYNRSHYEDLIEIFWELASNRSLDLSGTNITEFPEVLTVGGDLDLSRTPAIKLPEVLTVGGDLDLFEAQITELPEGLTVGGYLDISGTPITKLPEGLIVGGDLVLSRTQFTELPEGLTVGGGLYLSGTPIAKLPEGLNIGGNLDISYTQITELPDGLYINGYLKISGTKIYPLPRRLNIAEDFVIKDSMIDRFYSNKNIRKAVYIGGQIVR